MLESMGGGFHHPSQVHFFLFQFYNTNFLFCFIILEPSWPLKPVGYLQPPPQHTWLATMTILPAVPPQGHHSNCTQVQPASSDSNSNDKPSTDDETPSTDSTDSTDSTNSETPSVRLRTINYNRSQSSFKRFKREENVKVKAVDCLYSRQRAN